MIDDRGGNDRPGTPFIMKIGLTAQEKRDLVAFLKTLTDGSAIPQSPSN